MLTESMNSEKPFKETSLVSILVDAFWSPSIGTYYSLPENVLTE